jgi:hypothetical protein
MQDAAVKSKKQQVTCISPHVFQRFDNIHANVNIYQREEMIRRQERAKQAARDLADAIYCTNPLSSPGTLVSATKS